MENNHCNRTVSGQQGPESAHVYNLNPEGLPTAGTQYWSPPTRPTSAPGAFPVPPSGEGVNNWVFRAILHCKHAGLTEEEAATKVKSFEPTLHRPLRHDEISRAILKVYHTKGYKPQSTPEERALKWPPVNVEAQRIAIESSPIKCVADLIRSSDPVPTEHTSDQVVDLFFPGNPLICVGDAPWEFATDYRENLRGLEFVSLIVPSSMKAMEGMKSDGSGYSAHTLDNTGARRFIICEFDGDMGHDKQAAIIGHLGCLAPLACVCFSGSKSFHAWFRVEGHQEAEVLRFFRYAVTLGADDATWSRSQFCRLPGGYNHDTDARQEVYYLKPSAAMSSLPEPPKVGFQWNLVCGGETWTKDPDEIRNLSAKPVVYGLIRKGDVGSVVGAAKTSKTWYALGLALAVSQGHEFIGYQTVAHKTLYLDYELKEGTLLKRMCMLSESAPHHFTYSALRGLDPLPTFDDIEELVNSEGIEFLVLDSLYRTGLLSEENNNDSTSRELTRLQSLAARTGVTILVVDHTAKGGGNDRSAVDASRGASSKGGFFDFILVLRTFVKTGDPKANQVVLDPVVRDWPAPTHLPVLSFTWQDVSCEIKLEGEAPADDPQLKLGQLIDVLTEDGGWMCRAEIKKRSGMADTTVRNGLSKLVDQGKILQEQDPDHSQRQLYKIAPDKGVGTA